jgi:RHS repeat-associated protein/uncharacterized repeat protein (TIGR01451 family)
MKRQVEIFLRSLLIALFVFNAIIPSAAIAEDLQAVEKRSILKQEAVTEAAERLALAQQKNPVLALPASSGLPNPLEGGFAFPQDRAGLDFQPGAPADPFARQAPDQNFINRPFGLNALETSTVEPWLTDLPASPEVLTTQASEPTVTPTVEVASTAAPTATATAMQSEPPTPTATGEVSPTAAATATAQATVTVLATAMPTATAAPTNPAAPLIFNLSALPALVSPGDEVAFTVEIKNNSQKPVTGLVFSSSLPTEFGNGPNGLKDFSFDPKTRLLTWNGSEKPAETSKGKPGETEKKTSLAAGETLTLQYTLQLDKKLDQSEISVSATLQTEGLPEPLAAKTRLTVLTDGNRLTVLGPQGGKANGLDGKVEVSLPVGALKTLRGVLIQELKEKPQGLAGAPEAPGRFFKLELQQLPAALGDQALSQSGLSTVTGETVEAKFDQPVELTISFDGLAELATLGADQVPYLVTLDEASGTWVRVPIQSVDPASNSIQTEVTHFSSWGAGVGPAFPQNGANLLLFDKGYPETFSGKSRFSIPIWTPKGRNGMTPTLALSYSSGTVDGVLGDVQAPWVGMGWNVDTVEIARKIVNGSCAPCGGGSYGYENKFILLFNGTGYELLPDGTTPGRYHTKQESFLYLQLHNDVLGNNTPAANNASGEWWEVVERDGTRWRLGWNANSEQLAAMSGYPGAATGAWASLGYAGHAVNVVAGRWQADQVKDTFGNLITTTYVEETRLVAGTSVNYDRASYPDTISYTGHVSGSPASGYSVVFVRESRGGNEVPTPQNDWDNWDEQRLDRIEVRYGTAVVRMYDLSYSLRSKTDDGKTWQTTVLDAVAVSGGSTSAPTIAFTYADQDNRANCGAGCQEWTYPRLSAIANGWGATVTYTYGNDARPSTSWYNWRVEAVNVADGVNTSPMKTTYAYSVACYNDTSAGWCNVGNTGELIGYAQTIQTSIDFNGSTTLASTVHKFYTDQQKAGLEYETQARDASGTILSQNSTTYTVVTSGLPASGYFTYASAVDSYLRTGGSLPRTNRAEYTYEATTGNLTNAKYYDGTPSLYRENAYEYAVNLTGWILDKVSRTLLKDASGAILTERQYGYDGGLPGTAPSLGALTLTRAVAGSQTVDTGYRYDTYGNQTETRVYTAYGATGSQPGGLYRSSTTIYETGLYTYALSSTNPLSQTTSFSYNYGLGQPVSVTDANNSTTTTTYDGLGRMLTVTYPGSGQPNLQYTYPSLPVSTPFALKMEAWDQPDGVYRAAWQVLDGLGRVLQTQSPAQAAGDLALNDTSYDALGRMLYSGLPRTLTGAGGSYSAPAWGSLAHTTFSYDALGRTTTTAYPDGSHETYSYTGLRTATIDRNTHQKIRENDVFGRLVKVEEYTGVGTYSLYATTGYEYDPRDLLKKVTDAAGNQTTITYNGFGRKTGMSDPDMGSWGYAYDTLGNLTGQTDARTCVTTVTYDELNRPTGKSYSGPGACATTPALTYAYDVGDQGIGRRTGMTDGSGSTTWVYNALGQVTNQTNTVDGTAYPSSATNDAFGRPLTQTLPSGEVLNYGYNAMGALSSLSGTNTYLSNVHYSASGQVADQQLGNGLIQQSCYEANTLRLAALRAYPGALQSCSSTPLNARLNLTNTYQPNGNISQIVDGTHSETLNYAYDELDRLLGVSGPNQQGFTYNPIGNLIAKNTPGTFTAITAGGGHTCALTSAGGVDCWGLNYYGQLGNGTTVNSNAPLVVNGLTSGVTAIAAGYDHTCVLTSAGGVKCWGYNYYGQLGDGTTTNRSTPVDVSGLTSGVTAIVAGQYHTCALTALGGVKCWGSNGSGQLGDGTTTQRLAPVAVSGLTSGVTVIAAGYSHTCVLTSAGGVKCWGFNGSGQLGDGTTTQRLAPVAVSGLTSGVTVITAGYSHTCALTSTGGAKCWGLNNFGQLGDGTTINRKTSVAVSGLTSGATTIAASGWHTCALTSTGGTKCWGRNSLGQIGDGTTTDRFTPMDVSGLTNSVTAIATGHIHTCVLTNTGWVKCWGSNDSGQLGNGMPAPALHVTPVAVSGLTSGVTAITVGYYHTCALTSAGVAKCWGSNSFGQLGDGTVTNHITPMDVSGLANGVTAISGGGWYNCALTTSGGVKCWGANSSGQLGDGTMIDRLTPVDVSGLTSGVIAISASNTDYAHTCALTSLGGVKCWGYNGSGELGDGTTTDRLTPVDVSGLTSGVIAIAASDSYTCALTSAGGVKCWGYNGTGQLGDGTTTDHITPMDVSGLTSGVTAIAAGGNHVCALTSAGGVKCWGFNYYGALGNGITSPTVITRPMDVVGLTSGVTAIVGGIWHTCAMTTSGGVKCWGFNNKGELGDGTMTNRLTPVDVSGLASGVSAIAAGYDHTCALTTSGAVKCWGNNNDGKLGNGESSYLTTPTDIQFTPVSTTYSYNNSAHKHAVTSLSSGETYQYDANGNMTQRVEDGQTYTQVFDAENRLVSVTVNSQTTQFVYDGDGNLVKKVKPDGSRTIYVGSIYEVSKNAGGTVTGTTTYYPAAGAMRVNGVLYYVLKDQVGSASVVTDASGNVAGEQRYTPFGETRTSTGSMFTDHLYTGQRQMADIGLYHYGARFYSAKLGRFISPDSLVPGGGNPQAYNRYSYVLNNPILFNDPTGHKQACGTNGEDACPSHGYKTSSTSTSSGLVVDTGNGKRRNGGAVDDSGDEASAPVTPAAPPVIPPVIPPAPDPSKPGTKDGVPSLVPETTCPPPQTNGDDFTGFWELNRLSGLGVRFNISGWVPPIPVLGGDVALDFVYLNGSIVVKFTPSLLIGLGEGGAISPNLLLVYDAWDADALDGLTVGGQANVSVLGGAQASYGYSTEAGSDGKHAQIWGLGPSAGAEAAASFVAGYTFPVYPIPTVK